MDPAGCEGFLLRLRRLFGAMDEAYARAAEAYGFVCAGCEDSCCRTRFYHHTLLEYLNLRDGFQRLAAPLQAEVLARAADRTLCPLNREGRCRLYAHRPMICRLHGIPHELHPPGRSPQHSPGCEEFHRRCGRAYAHPFDRTPLYAELARLEAEFQNHLGERRKIRMTIADMLLEDRVIP
jgi:Fe-S-cluster containining protein